MAAMTSDFCPDITVGRRGFFGRMFDAMVEARSREAERYVNNYLLTLNDHTLTELGFERAKLRRAVAR